MATVSGPKTYKILVVDDDLDTLKLVGTTLEKQGFIIVAAKDGQEALDKVYQHLPDLILLDIMMPKLDGYEVTRRLRADPVTASIPIILFTAKAQVDDKVTGLEAGADEYLTKPTHPAELVARVRSILKRPVTSMLPPLPGEPAAGTTGTVIGIMGAKGGQGVSTLAVNLGAGLQQTFISSNVIVAELRPGHGDIGIQLGVKSTQGLNELLKRTPQDLHRAVIEKALVTHKSGLKLLLSSNNPSDVNLFSAANQMASVVRELALIAPYCLLDLGVGLHTATLRALEQCSHIIVVAEPDLRTMPHTKALIEELKKLGLSKKITIVMVHRVRTEQAMSGADVQKALGLDVGAVFTPAPELAYQAARVNQPMLLVEPDSFTTQQTLKLVNVLTQPATE